MDHLNFTPQPIDKKLVQLAQKYELQILQLSGLKASQDFVIEDVPIQFYGPNHIHTVQFGDNNSLDLVVIHGYLASGVLYYRMMRDLAKTFRVYLIDMLGMGLSSRPKFNVTDTTQAVEFFIDSIEKWRIAKGLKKFQILGHSLGGYVAGHYALKYPDNILRISLVSPAAITKHLEEFDLPEYMKTLSFARRMTFKFFMSYWDKKTSPQAAMKSLGFVGRSLLSRYINNRFKRPKEESELLYNYFLNVMMMPESSDKAVFYVFKPPRARAVLPLEDYMLNMDMPVDFYFGEQDWMDWTGAKRVCENTNGRCNLYWIKDAGHQITMDNPDMLSQLLIKNSASLMMKVGMTMMQQSIKINGTGMIVKNKSETMSVQKNEKDKEKALVQKILKNEHEEEKEGITEQEILFTEASDQIPTEIGGYGVGVGIVRSHSRI